MSADPRFKFGRPQWWLFDPGPVPAAEEVEQHRLGLSGGGYVGTVQRRYCPRCACLSGRPDATTPTDGPPSSPLTRVLNPRFVEMLMGREPQP